MYFSLYSCISLKYKMKIFVLFVLVISFFISLFACSEPAATVPPPEIIPKRQAFLDEQRPPTHVIDFDPCIVELFLVPPKLGETGELTCEFNVTSEQGFDIKADIYLQKGIQFVSGYRTWTGHIPQDHSLILKCLIKPVETGNWVIGARAASLTKGIQGAKRECRLLKVTEKESSIEYAECPNSLFK
jgi:hypothetical protein